jgi:hypothetical protein
MTITLDAQDRELIVAAAQCQANYYDGLPACEFAQVRAELWAERMSQPETRMRPRWGLRRIVEQTREGWTR